MASAAPTPQSAPFRLGQRPWLDGMRALAVLCVIGFHESFLAPGAHVPWVGPGGDLGVDVFFVISGFLITSLLLEERRRSGVIRLAAFYGRRARRLLPAVGALLFVLIAGGAVFASRGGFTHILEHAAATATYSANWVRAAGVDIVELNHTWSLAVEEQFYLVWPLVLLTLLVRGVRGRTLALGLAAVSIAAVVWRTEVAAHLHWSQMRVYNGFDTRCDGLLMGCALAAAVHHSLLPSGRLAVVLRRSGAVLGGVAIALLVHDPGAVARITHRAVDAAAVTGLATAVIIWALLTDGGTIAGRALASWPLRSVGRISYGLYLYSFPVTALISRQLLGHLSPTVVLGLHLVASFSVATASYFTVERVFRRPRTEVSSTGLLLHQSSRSDIP